VSRDAGQRQRGHPIRTGSALDAVALLGFVLLIAWTYAFLGVHELKHIGQADASACKFTLIASTLGGSESPTIPPLPVPPALEVHASHPAPAGELPGEASPQQARAPPALA
jgi:hypothetical protein